MIRIAIIIGALALTGCASTSEPVNPTMARSQYCYTSQDIKVQNGSTVSSETNVKCNDDPVEQIVIKKAGMATNCGIFEYWMRKDGQIVWKEGISCRLPNGSYRVVDSDISR
jgi:hypothetical protein